ncbi:MAG: glucuronate isomerase, partial [Prevotella sp.]|nr:glucuronate isomerase [Prevotella sp.]
CNEKLKQPEYTARGLMRRYHVECVCTTDDPVDDLRYHKQTRESGFEIKMIPAWRPDKAMNIEKPEFPAYVAQLAKVSGVSIVKFADMVDALQKRHDFFSENGCKLSDHGIEEFYDEPYTDSQIEIIFEKAMRGQQLSTYEVRQYKNCFLTIMAEMDNDAGWTQQFHYGAIRDNNTLMYNQLGADTGFDSIGEFNTARAMSNFLNRLNMKGKLTRTILYTLNPCANEVIATMLGNFQDGSCPGKIQFGSGWWFNDQLDGMTRQMNALSVLGLLSRFVGMLTDSRSFLSYPRHEYFRRLLCNLLGNDVEKGLLPDDMESLSRMVEDISYNNAKNYFKFY